MLHEYGLYMDNTHRRDETDTPSKPADGPLTRLVDHEGNPAEPAPATRLPQPPEVKRQGRDDYASGTPEHDDDRES